MVDDLVQLMTIKGTAHELRRLYQNELCEGRSLDGNWRDIVDSFKKSFDGRLRGIYQKMAQNDYASGSEEQQLIDDIMFACLLLDELNKLEA